MVDWHGISSWHNIYGVAGFFALMILYVALDCQISPQKSSASAKIKSRPPAFFVIPSSDRPDNIIIRNHTSYLKNMPDHDDTKIPNEFQYRPPDLSGVIEPGIPFNLTTKDLASLGIPLGNLSVLDDITVKDFVFVGGASSNHFREAMGAIAGVQRHMPNYTIFYYDLGLNDTEIKLLKTLCKVKYRKFDYNKYPQHVKNLYTYAFKPLIIHEILQTEHAVLWMDTSFRLLRHLNVTYDNILHTGGILMFGVTPYSNYPVTHPGMYQYLPTDIERQKRVRVREASPLFLHKTAKVYREVIYWWVLCALDKACIAPQGAKYWCQFSKTDPHGTFANCHRFDQSALNILVSNLYGYDTEAYTERTGKVAETIRNISKTNTPQTCA